MSINDNKILNAILNPNTPFEVDTNEELSKSSKKSLINNFLNKASLNKNKIIEYEINDAVLEAKKLEVEGKFCFIILVINKPNPILK